MANKDPFLYSMRKNGKPHVFKGLVQAGSTASIDIGDLCTYNETTGYFIPVNAVADHRYPLAAAKEGQLAAAGRSGVLNGARYIDFYSLHPEDVFEYELAAATGVAYGDPYTLTASAAQKLTAGAGAFAVAYIVGGDHYPQEEDTTIISQTYGQFSFNASATYWGYRFAKSLVAGGGGRRMISTAADLTLTENECYNSLILVTAAKTITLPAVKPGMDLIVTGTGANAINVDPNGSDKIRLAGAQLDDGDKLTSGGAAGDSVRLFTESADGWIAIKNGGTWADGS